MPRVLLILALVATAFWVFTIVDCAAQPATRHRGVSKPVWVLIVVLLPVLGGILWLVVGRVRAKSVQARKAPDDDPEFLERIGTLSDQDERIRRLEEELAQLDAEDEDPAPPPSPGPSAPAAKPTAGPGGSPAPTGSAAPSGSGAPADPSGRGGTPDADDDTRGQRGVAG